MTSPKFGLLSYPAVGNLGDAIQSLAAKRFLPKVDMHVPRENLSRAPDGPVRLICNGWFMQQPGNWPPHPLIEPLLISMHFAAHDFTPFRRLKPRPVDLMLSKDGLAFLEKWGPVGTRDEFTLEELSRRNLPAYLSGCLTLTLQRPAQARSKHHIVACDLEPAYLEHLQRTTKRNVVVTSHAGDRPLDPTAKEERAENQLLLYAEAAAVVTTRIHAALPCLAMGTPVLLIKPASHSRRVSDIARLMHSCEGYQFLRGNHDFDCDNPPPNPVLFHQFVKPLEDRCRAFVKA